MNRKKKFQKDMIIVLAIIMASITSTTVVSASQDELNNEFPDGAPLQNAIKKAIASEKFAKNDIDGVPEYNLEVLEKTENHIKLKAKTKIKFKNPRGAGHEDNRWPKFEVTHDPNMEGEGIIKPGDYDQKVKDYILSEIQKIPDKNERSKKLREWKNYDFERGERTFIFEEIYEVTYETTYPRQSGSPSIAEEQTHGNILMGFTKTKRVSWIIETKLQIFWFTVFWFKSGFELDGALGLRLPTQVTLNSPNIMVDKQNYLFSTYIYGIDWNSDQYSTVLVPPENGNEFVARLKFFIGVKAIIANIPVISWYIETDRNYGKSFKTPIGPNENFPILDIILNPDQTGLKFGWSIAYLGIGIKVDTNIGSETITAKWNTNGDAVGSGLVEYKRPETNYNFGPITAGDYNPTTNYANIRLSGYKYYFDVCDIDVSANIDLGGILSFVPDFPYYKLFSVGCSDLTGGLYLGTHSGTTGNIQEDILVTDGPIVPIPEISSIKMMMIGIFGLLVISRWKNIIK